MKEDSPVADVFDSCEACDRLAAENSLVTTVQPACLSAFSPFVMLSVNLSSF